MEVAINWWAVVVSMVASVVIGFVWYGPLFGKAWMRETGIHMPEHGHRPSMAKPIIISLLGAFFMAYVLANSLALSTALSSASGATLGLIGGAWYWFGFIVPIYLNYIAWEGKSWKLFAISAGYWLVLMLVMSAILAGWR